MHLEEDAPALAPPPGLVARRGRIGDDDFLLLEWPEALPALPAALTAAEREVLALLAGGGSNAEIAAVRGTSPRTVARQVSAVFQKVGVHSRAELLARVPRPTRLPTPGAGRGW